MKCNSPNMTPEQREWLFTCLEDLDLLVVTFHGSWLYGLEREGSDIDVKAIYLPSKEDLLTGKALKTYNKKNEELDIELEIKSLPSFLNSCSKCDTNCVDLLHTPDNMILFSAPEWLQLREYRKGLYAKNMRGLIGYIKTHTHKYGNKIERLKEMEKVLSYSEKEHNMTIGDLVTCSALMDNNFKYVKVVAQVQDHEQQYLEVCGKKYIFTWDVPQLTAAMKKEISRYGSRTEDGKQKGLDTKSLSHALRVLREVEEIIDYGTIEFPLRDKDNILRIKLGEVPVEVVMKEISESYDRVISKLENSDLPDDVDIQPMLEVLKGYYFE